MSRTARAALFLTLASAAIPAGAAAQTPTPGLDAVRPLYAMVKGYLLATPDAMPAEKWDYRPTPEVRTFGEILGHVANSNYEFCAAAKGEKNPQATDLEKAGRDEVVAGLKASFAYCDGVYAGLTPKQAAEPAELFGMKGNRLWLLDFNMGHDYEHYGNLVTYLRLNGIVPPSSRNSGA